MTNNDRVFFFQASYRAKFEEHLAKTEARNPSTWNFYKYVFEREDLTLIQQMNCKTLIFSEPRVRVSASDHSLKQELLTAFLCLKGVKALVIDVVTMITFFVLPDLYQFVYRTPISHSLEEVCLSLPNEFDHSLAKGLEYASSITILTVISENHAEINYVYRYFRSINLRDICFQNASLKDCVALMREKQSNSLEKVTFGDRFVTDPELVSKYLSAVLLKEPATSQLYGIIPTDTEVALSEYQKQIFKRFEIDFD